MNTLKRKNMIGSAVAMGVHDGTITLGAVADQIPPALMERLTGAELGIVMGAINTAYHAGRKSTGAEMMDPGAVWISREGGGQCVEWTDPETIQVKTYKGQDHTTAVYKLVK